jgi:GAF domain-containing protein
MFLGDLTDLLREIMVEARKLTNAERCSLFLLDSEHDHLVAKIFDGETSTEVSFMRLNSFNMTNRTVAFM